MLRSSKFGDSEKSRLWVGIGYLVALKMADQRDKTDHKIGLRR